MATALITRKEYLSAGSELFVPGQPQQSAEYKQAKTLAHENYYAQFVTKQTLSYVRARFTVEELIKAQAKDVHLNTIKLEHWDRLTWHPLGDRGYSAGDSGPFHSSLPINSQLVEELGESVTRAFLVCVAKRAARMLIAGETVAD